MLGNLNRQRFFADRNCQRIVYLRQIALIKAHVNNRTHNLSYASYI